MTSTETSPLAPNPYCNGDRASEHLVAFVLTHVQFHRDDPLGGTMAFISLIPIALIASYFSVLVTSRNAWVALAMLGQLGNEVLNSLLKKYIKERRPYRELNCG
jgi:dolichyldiphosphatase